MPYRTKVHKLKPPPGRKHHAPKKYTDARSFRSKARWQRFRKSFINKYPLCCDPLGDHEQDQVVVAATDVHHIVPLEERIDLGCTQANCAPLCNRCHMKIENKERRQAGSTRQLFANAKWR